MEPPTFSIFTKASLRAISMIWRRWGSEYLNVEQRRRPLGKNLDVVQFTQNMRLRVTSDPCHPSKRILGT
jgi:hypothetical protein